MPHCVLHLSPSSWSLLLIVCFLLSTHILVDAMILAGQFKQPTPWHFFTKFCFSNEFGGVGQFTYSITTPSDSLQVAIYLGTSTMSERGSWDNVYDRRESSSCEELVSLQRNQSLAKVYVKSGNLNIVDLNQVVRPYFWYIALADCKRGSIDVESFRMTFSNPGGLWYEQFSFDEQGVVQYYIFFTILYLILILLHLWGVIQLIRAEAWHKIVRILSAAITFQFLACTSETIHYCIYLYDGIGVNGIKSFGELLTMVSQLLLMFLCVLVAQGWAITTSQLTHRNILFITAAIFFLAYMALFIWDNAGRDPASTLYFYESIPGLIVLLFRVGLTGWFLWSLRSTIGLEALPDKRRFYSIFGFCFTVWFLLLPGIVAFSLILDPWYRFRTVRGMSLCSDALAYIAFITLLWPSRALSFFDIKPTPLLLLEATTAYGTDQNL